MANIFQFDWEVSLIVWLQNIIENRPFLKSLFVLLTQFGEPILPVLLAVVVYYGYKKEWGRNMILSFLFPQIITDQLKNIFLRMRPYMANEVIKCLWAPEKGYDIYDIARQGYSFPSGHATSISAVMATLYLYERKKLFAKSYLPVVFLVCLSRVALGVHYPTDVLTGALISLVAVFVFDALIKKVSKKILYPLLTLYCLTGVLFCHSDDYYSVIGLTMGFMLADLFEERNRPIIRTYHYQRKSIRFPWKRQFLPRFPDSAGKAASDPILFPVRTCQG